LVLNDFKIIPKHIQYKKVYMKKNETYKLVKNICLSNQSFKLRALTFGLIMQL